MNKTASAIFSLFLASMTIFLAGCGGGPVVPGGGQVDDNATVGLTATNQKALDDAGASYLALVKDNATTPAAARTSLVESLKTASGVSQAKLSTDGYTIWLKFSDNQTAAINTDNTFGSGSTYDPTAMKTAVNTALTAAGKSTVAKSIVPAKRPEGTSVYLPHAKKILFLSSASEDLAGKDVELFDTLKDFLVQAHGWADQDLVLKYNRAEDGYSTLSYDDFYNLGDYGVIVIFAHGITRVINPDDPGNLDNDWADASQGETHYYIQVRALPDSASGKLIKDMTAEELGMDPALFDLEKKDGRIVLVSNLDAWKQSCQEYFYIRDDLWEERMADLPNSMVLLCGPYGWLAWDAIGYRRAGDLVAWDGPVSTQAAMDVAWILPVMVGLDLSDVETFAKNLVPQTFEDSTLHLWPGGTTYEYLPTWADVSTTNAPTGTQTVLVKMAYTDTTLAAPDPSQIQDIPSSVKNFVDLVPGEEVTFTAQALSSTNAVLAEVKTTTKLSTGKNTVTFDFKVIYAENFNDGTAGPEWSLPRTATINGRTFLGPFVGDKWMNMDNVWMKLENLPTHTRVTVSFDLILMGSWDGNQEADWADPKPGTGADIFDMGYIGNGGMRYAILNTTFATSTGEYLIQCYPGGWPGGDNPANTGAAEVNTLGAGSAVYRITREFQHIGSTTLELWFESDGRATIDASDDTYGIDNIQIGLK